LVGKEFDTVRNLAKLHDSSLWTLLDRTTLGEIADDGRIVRRIRLEKPHLGVFGFGGQLVYQTGGDPVPSPALLAAPPGSQSRSIVGSLRTKPFGLGRAEDWGLNLAVCGSGFSDGIPCWLATEAVVDLLIANGTSQRWELVDLVEPVAAPVNVDDPPQPIRDAYLMARETLLVLGTAGGPQQSGRPKVGWRLWSFTSKGTKAAVRPLDQPARRILGVRDDLCFLLSVSGAVIVVGVP
jgi:hypothetical protein